MHKANSFDQSVARIARRDSVDFADAYRRMLKGETRLQPLGGPKNFVIGSATSAGIQSIIPTTSANGGRNSGI